MKRLTMNRNKNARDRRRARAAERAAEYAALTPKQKLDRLDYRLGKGVGAFRERARLLAQMAAGMKPPAPETAAEVFGTKKQGRGHGRGARK